MRILLIFCYILLNIFMVSCGEKTTEKEASQTSEKEQNTTETTSEIKREIILFFGTSLTAGLGVDLEEAYPAIIQQKIDSLQLPYEVINAGLSGETTASGKSRLNWVLNQEVAIFVLELGANDGLRGVNLTETKKNLQEIIDQVKSKNNETIIILAGMEMPPNLGPEYTTEFRNLFPELANENELILLPFLLENVGGIPKLNQQDGIHPTAEGQKIMAQTVWKILKPLIIQD